MIVHGRTDIDIVLAHRRPVTLLSGRGAASYAGCEWWRALMDLVHAHHPDATIAALLDCAGASGHALAAMRVGLRGLVLEPLAPGYARVAAIARRDGILLLESPPPALDMAHSGAAYRLGEWL